MEIDLQITDKTKHDLVKKLHGRLINCPEYHLRNEVIVSQLMKMILKKTLMYGRTDDSKELDLETRILRAYYEGIGRKADRLKNIVKRITRDHDISLSAELLDTIVDIFGYSLMALNALSEDLQEDLHK